MILLFCILDVFCPWSGVVDCYRSMRSFERLTLNVRSRSTLNVINQPINQSRMYVCVASISLADMLSWLYQSNIVLYICNYVCVNLCDQ